MDIVDTIHSFLDPISCSLQERVKFGGHITSVTRLSEAKKGFFFELKEGRRQLQITKKAIMSAEIERQEKRDNKEKVYHTISD